MPGQIPLPADLKVQNSEDGFKRVSILGYTGRPVSLSGYPHYIDDPVVYNTAGIEMKDRLPYYENHVTLLGHTESNVADEGNIKTIAVHSDPEDYTNIVHQRMENGIPYQASMGLNIDGEDVTFVPEGVNVEVNNRSFQGPIYVVNKSTLVEMSVTLHGRDSDTEAHTLSQSQREGKEILMTVKNSSVNNAEKKTAPKVEGGKTKYQSTASETPSPEREKAIAEEKVEKAKKKESVKVDNSWLFDYIDFPHLVKNARKESWTEDQMKDAIRQEEREAEARRIENSYPGVPTLHVKNRTEISQEDIFAARLAASMNVSPDTVERHLGKQAADVGNNAPVMGLREALMITENSEIGGAKFSGHGDVTGLCKAIKRRVLNSAFSVIDFPNLMHRVADWKLEERWQMEQPQSLQYCKKISTSDFKQQGFLKPKGGKQWENFNHEGKITHGTFGSEDTYTTQLDTVAQIVTFDRQTIINDDIGYVEEMMDMMLEGAIMIPDLQFVKLVYGANGAGVLNTLRTLAFNEANFETVYEAVRRRTMTKKSAKGDKSVNARFNTRWSLVHSIGLEKEVFDLINQSTNVAGTGTIVREKNYWYNRVDSASFDNLDNTSYHSSAANNVWMLIPQRESLRPFYVRYLNNQTRPTTELVDLAEDMLGFGVRGYWDINMGYRPVENDKLQAFELSIP